MTTASSFSDAAGNGAEPVREQNARTTTALEVERLPQRDSPFGAHAYHHHGKALPAGQSRLVLFPEAIQQLSAHAASDRHREVGGVLLGAAYRHDAQLYAEARSALPVFSSDHGPVHFTFNADAWSQIHRDRAEKFPNLDIVGWFHTHPGLGIFFSADDVVVHSAAFVLPWHVALVIDPLHAKIGVFGWQDGQLAALSGFFELLPEAGASSSLRWDLQQGEIWNESYLERVAARRRSDGHERSAWRRPDALHAFVLGALAFVLSLALLVGGFLPLSSRNEALETVVVALAERTMQEANQTGAASCTSRALQIYAPLPDEQIAYGSEITLVGFADAPQAQNYRLEVRPFGEQTWWSLGSFRRPVRSGAFLTWDTSSFAPGVYQLRLSAADDAGETLANPSACTVRFELVGTSAEGS